MRSLTVVIPTYNRGATLQKALLAYFNQTALQDIAEILVVDDGSTDSTRDVVARLSDGRNGLIRYYRQDNKGPASARNVGIREAKTSLILFTDDDILPTPTLVSEHLRWHNQFPELEAAVLGQVTWAPEIRATPFMKWYGSDGPLFAYAHFAGHTELHHTCFYTCNLSVKTEFLRKNGGFDEDFKVAAFEDLELGYRLNNAGMCLRYSAAAMAYHHQYVTFADACRRSKKAASAVEVFKKKEAGRTASTPRLRQMLGKLVKLGTWPLFPMKVLMDSRVPLPWSMYRLMYRVYR